MAEGFITRRGGAVGIGVAIQKTPPPINERLSGEIWTIEELDDIRNSSSSNFTLMRHLDFNKDFSYDDPTNKSTYITGEGWLPFVYSGEFEGNGFGIINLYINRPNTNDVALFFGNEMLIKNLLIHGNVTGNNDVSLIAGLRDGSSCENVAVFGRVVGNGEIVGGLTGGSSGAGETKDCYSFVNVEGDDQVGGFIGRHRAGNQSISTSYSVGLVEGNTSVGGFAGNRTAPLPNTFWDTQTSNQSTSSGSTGLTTAQMTGSSATNNLTGFDFNNVWKTVVASQNFAFADGYPILRSIKEDLQLFMQNTLGGFGGFLW